MHVAAGLDAAADRGRQFRQERVLLDRVHGVEAQAVETVFVQPVQRVLLEVVPNLGPPGSRSRRPRACACPRRRTLGDTRGCRRRPGRNGCTRHPASPSGPSRARGRSSPSARPGCRRLRPAHRAARRRSPSCAAGKVGDRHELDRRDAEVAQAFELVRNALESRPSRRHASRTRRLRATAGPASPRAATVGAADRPRRSSRARPRPACATPDRARQAVRQPIAVARARRGRGGEGKPAARFRPMSSGEAPAISSVSVRRWAPRSGTRCSRPVAASTEGQRVAKRFDSLIVCTPRCDPFLANRDG